MRVFSTFCFGAGATVFFVSVSFAGSFLEQDVKAIISQLKTESEEFATLVTAGSADEIGAALTHLHDTFHKIQEKWYGGGEKHQEEEHEE